MPEQSTVWRALHDVGLAAWFGGSLMGAVGLNAAAGAVDSPDQRIGVANAGWARWTPVNAVAVAAHAAGAVALTRANSGRMLAQEGVAGIGAVKGGLTVAALAATGYAHVLGRQVERAGDVAVADGTTPSSATPPSVQGAQRRLSVLQWLIPALTGALLVLNAKMGEQQRPLKVVSGVARRRLPF